MFLQLWRNDENDTTLTGGSCDDDWLVSNGGRRNKGRSAGRRPKRTRRMDLAAKTPSSSKARSFETAAKRIPKKQPDRNGGKSRSGTPRRFLRPWPGYGCGPPRRDRRFGNQKRVGNPKGACLPATGRQRRRYSGPSTRVTVATAAHAACSPPVATPGPQGQAVPRRCGTTSGLLARSSCQQRHQYPDVLSRIWEERRFNYLVRPPTGHFLGRHVN